MRKGFYFLAFLGLFPFRRCIPLSSLCDIDILRDSVSDLKNSTRSVTVDIFNWFKRKNVLLENMDKKQMGVWELLDLST